MKASVWHAHKKIKIISVSLYPATLEIQDDPVFMHSSSPGWNIVP